MIDGLIKEEKDKGKELGLAAFNGTCNRCGHQGHKEAEHYVKRHINEQALTPKSNSGSAGSKKDQNSRNHDKKKRFQGNCNYCGKFGHKEADCRKKAADIKYGNQETAVAAISDGNRAQFLLCSKDKVGCMAVGTTTNQIFPNSHKLLKQPSIWIGDTVATMDITPHDIVMVNKHLSKESVSIVMGNKQVEKLIAIGDIPCMICNNQGVHIVQAMRKDLAFVPDCAFNLFSISKRLKQGWRLGGTSDALVFTSHNGNNQIYST